ncbi:MAG: hypothetical protein K0U74_09850 [Alphaproteobacteria bacterium]|nr:hypothetical protein [Alphaproteobacteria bacterium]
MSWLSRAQDLLSRTIRAGARDRLLIASVAISALMGIVAWLLGGRPPLIGIDDAAITRSYAENIANGHGFVYNIGGERVEGATSFLWTLIVAVAYAVTSTPAFLIFATCFVATVAATYAALSLANHFGNLYRLPSRPLQWAMVVALIGLPGFYLWSTLSLMEVAVWAGVLLWLIVRCVEWIDEERQSDLAMIALAASMPLLRPEGVAMAIGLLGLTAVLSPGRIRAPLFAIGACVASFIALTGFRLAYFGYPFPNTYYAKVSADRLQNFMDGLKYIIDYVLQAPGAQIFIVAWAVIAVIVIRGIVKNRSLSGTSILIPAAAVFGVLATYAALGGDHFKYWRFIAPITPIVPLASVLAVAWLLQSKFNAALSEGTARWALGVLAVGWLGISLLHYHQSRFVIVREYVINERGLKFGEAFNELKPAASIGVGAAGGVALTYDGPIRDMLGLNWTEMAHANPIKIGFRNHASFDRRVFWANQPDVVALFNRQCPTKDALLWAGQWRSLYLEKQFRIDYEPVLFKTNGGCWPLLARKSWLQRLENRQSLQSIAWERFMDF